MGVEVERKFLVSSDSWRSLGRRTEYRQGYLSRVTDRVVRVRTIDGKGFLTIKGKTRGVTRSEYEYEIPLADATAMLDNLCEKPLIEKSRYIIDYEGFTWEVDEFHGDNQGLIVAEIELTNERQDFARPDWIGAEVSDDPKYFNSSLVEKPFSQW